MENLKSIIAENIVSLRKSNAMTQIELAERLNYSDKSISKWERGESVPGVAVLKQMADIFGVTVDYLITAAHADQGATKPSVAFVEEPADKLAEESVAPNVVEKVTNKGRRKKTGTIKLLFARVGKK